MQLDSGSAVTVLERLDALEAAHGLPRIEAAERRRLSAYAAGTAPSSALDWRPLHLPGWYLGLHRRRGDGVLVGEAGRLDAGPSGDVLEAATAAGAGRVWLRGADPSDIAAAHGMGWVIRRELLVLGRTSDGVDGEGSRPVPPGLHLTTMAAVGFDAIAALLSAAYVGPRRDGFVEDDPDVGPWTTERVARTTSAVLADPSDLLLAVDERGRLAGLHWIARRAHGLGEVFNLAVAPDHAGRGLGSHLLTAGLDRLAGLGRHEVILWVDRANAPARALYARHGFVERGRDTAIEPATAGQPADL